MKEILEFDFNYLSNSLYDFSDQGAIKNLLRYLTESAKKKSTANLTRNIG